MINRISQPKLWCKSYNGLHGGGPTVDTATTPLRAQLISDLSARLWGRHGPVATPAWKTKWSQSKRMGHRLSLDLSLLGRICDLMPIFGERKSALIPWRLLGIKALGATGIICLREDFQHGFLSPGRSSKGKKCNKSILLFFFFPLLIFSNSALIICF